MPILRVLLPNRPAVSHELVGSRLTVGRRPDNTVQIIDASVSAHHAELLQEGEHYRLHDLGSTNLSFVDGQPVTDFHLHHSCKIMFGTVECEYDASPVEAPAPGLTPREMEKDVSFLRTENYDLQQKINALQRQIDILASARLVRGNADTPTDADALKRVTAERDEARYQNAGLKLELEKLRGEIDTVSRERDHARRAHELLQSKNATPPIERSSPLPVPAFDDKGTTQRIVFPGPPSGRE
ncbi:MAG TPA: FHA domain-containing protein [Chthoniobacteraceae bacterium]|jgi:hypothetical protein|nr:FHA domain-containing protein [Chthoniobacteraceae bacterium]